MTSGGERERGNSDWNLKISGGDGQKRHRQKAEAANFYIYNLPDQLCSRQISRGFKQLFFFLFCSPEKMANLFVFPVTASQLLELNIISAQELSPVSKRMKAYAVAWVHPERKLSTRVDYTGGPSPTWNDKFVFRLHEDFLFSDTSAVMIEIYALHWFRDIHVGTVRVLISNLIPPSHRRNNRNSGLRRTPPPGMRFVALQVRRPSGRPQGILNIGVGLLDSSMRSMPLYTHMDDSAVGYRDLLGEEDPHLQHLSRNSCRASSRNPQSPVSKQLQSSILKPRFRRTKSDTSSLVASDLLSRAERSRVASKHPASSVATSESDSVPTTSSVNDTASRSDATSKLRRKKRFEFMDFETPRPPPIETPCPPPVETRKTPRRPTRGHHDRSGGASPYLSRHGTPLRSNIVGSTPLRPGQMPIRPGYMATPMKSFLEMGTPMRSNLAGRPILTESELGPSPSEMVAHGGGTTTTDDAAGSSIVSEWSIDDGSVEGLRTRLERWRSELPPLYDLGSSHVSSDVDGVGAAGSARNKTPAAAAAKKHKRRHTEGGNGLFSCFSNICGVECSFICGSDPDGSKNTKKNADDRKGRGAHRPSSADNLSIT